MTPNERTSPPCSAIATAIVSAWTSRPTNSTLDMSDQFLSYAALRRWFSPTHSVTRDNCEQAAGRSILTDRGRRRRPPVYHGRCLRGLRLLTWMIACLPAVSQTPPPSFQDLAGQAAGARDRNQLDKAVALYKQ